MTPANPYPPLILGLLSPDAYPEASSIRRIDIAETHISWVLLVGHYAYKIKKPVRLSFLDFSTLELRQQFCLEELRLNHRYSPELYLEVLAITGTVEVPRMGGTGPIIEYALKMRRFPSALSFDRMADDHRLFPEHVTALAKVMAEFHHVIRPERSINDSIPQECIDPYVEANFSSIDRQLTRTADRSTLNTLHEWTNQEKQRLLGDFSARAKAGFVRECHGDLHLGNIVLLKGCPRLFDGIEFNPDLRWIDTMNEIAFTVMDLEARGLPRLAYLFLNHYLEITGDYRGLKLLDYYRLYRAMVRAKVTMIRREQTPNPAERESLLNLGLNYLNYGLRLIRKKKPCLLITHGFSGSGKSSLAEQLAATLPAICIRSDVERKRLLGQSVSYDPAATHQVYGQLMELAREILSFDHHVILDATFLKRKHRVLARRVAEATGTTFKILDCRASWDILEKRLAERSRAGGDPSDADQQVLRLQLKNAEPLTADELEFALTLDMEKRPQPTELVSLCCLIQDVRQAPQSARGNPVDGKSMT
jgi:aminoglycoside phosphotransferase family enzyme/predicted kinase